MQNIGKPDHPQSPERVAALKPSRLRFDGYRVGVKPAAARGEVKDGLEVVWDFGPIPKPISFSDLTVKDQKALRLAFPSPSAFDLENAVDLMLMLLARYFEIRRSTIAATIMEENLALKSMSQFMGAAGRLIRNYADAKPNTKAIIHQYWPVPEMIPKTLERLEYAVGLYSSDCIRLKRGRGAPLKKDNLLTNLSDELVKFWLLTTGNPVKFTAANRDSAASFFETLVRATPWEVSAKLETREIGVGSEQLQRPKDVWRATIRSSAQAPHIVRAVQDAFTRRRRLTPATTKDAEKS